MEKTSAPGAEHGLVATVPASHRGLLLARGTAAFTTVDQRGRPQSTAVWYLVDDDGQLKLSTTTDRQKYKNLRINPFCVLLLIDPADTHRTLEIRAEADLRADPDSVDVARFATAYGIDPHRVIADNRYTIVLHAVRIVTNQPT